MPLTLDDLKLYLRVPDDTDDALIKSQLAAAEAYIAGKVSRTHRIV